LIAIRGNACVYLSIPAAIGSTGALPENDLGLVKQTSSVLDGALICGNGAGTEKRGGREANRSIHNIARRGACFCTSLRVMRHEEVVAHLVRDGGRHGVCSAL
jgi:hypothetical protein